MKVSFVLPASELMFWDVSRERYCLEEGEVQIMVGSSSTDIRLSSVIDVEGEAIPPRLLDQPTKAVNYDDYHQVIIDKGEDDESCVTAKSDAAWICFRRCDLTAAIRSFEIRLYSQVPGAMELRLDSVDGPMVGECLYSAEGWQTRTCDLSDVNGATRDLYIRLTQQLKVSSFRTID
jgi:beta-glucosidase